METNLQILFFTSTIVLQIVLIVTVIKDFKVFQEVAIFMKQEGLVAGTCGCGEHETESKNDTEKHADGEEKQMRDLYEIPEGEELLFIKQVKLNKDDPVTEIDIIADRKAK